MLLHIVKRVSLKQKIIMNEFLLTPFLICPCFFLNYPELINMFDVNLALSEIDKSNACILTMFICERHSENSTTLYNVKQSINM